MYYVYVLLWATNKHYIGYTSNIEQRFAQHKNWQVQTTKSMGNLKLLWYFTKETKTQAIKLEQMIKRNGHIDHRINHPTFIQNI